MICSSDYQQDLTMKNEKKENEKLEQEKKRKRKESTAKMKERWKRVG